MIPTRDLAALHFQRETKRLGGRLILEAHNALHQAVHAEQVAAVGASPTQYLVKRVQGVNFEGSKATIGARCLTTCNVRLWKRERVACCGRPQLLLRGKRLACCGVVALLLLLLLLIAALLVFCRSHKAISWAGHGNSYLLTQAQQLKTPVSNCPHLAELTLDVGLRNPRLQREHGRVRRRRLRHRQHVQRLWRDPRAAVQDLRQCILIRFSPCVSQ